jgi:tripartite-type tricarboxylate transporter receptor subunit TctC
MLGRMANSDDFVPFGGTAPAVSAVPGEHIVVAHVHYPAAARQFRRQAAPPPARRRIAGPQVPTGRVRLQDYDLDLWYGLFAPAKLQRGLSACGLSTQSVQAPEISPKLAARNQPG